MNSEAAALYGRLQEMYELMSQIGGTEDIEEAIFAYEDCVSDEDYQAWLGKYAYYQ